LDALGRGDIAKTIVGFALALAAFGLAAVASALPSERASERVALAARNEPLSVAFTDCDDEPLGKQAFLRVLMLELGRRQLRDSAPEEAAISVTYRCDGTAHVRVALTSPEIDREFRVDDVALRERARALALVVAELARGGEPPASKPWVSEDSEPGTPPANGSDAANSKPKSPPEKPSKKPAPGAPSRSSEKLRDEGVSSANMEKRRAPPTSSVLLAADARLNLDATSLCYGGKLGFDYDAFRFALEGCGGFTRVSRGTITSGIGALRVGRAQPLLRIDSVQLGLHLGVAAGVNWSLGNSSVVNTHVRRALMPYADARLGLFAAARSHTPFTPLVELYGGRSLGIVSNADGEQAAATGGWFAGLELGLWL
jgi:hypothetical protein